MDLHTRWNEALDRLWRLPGNSWRGRAAAAGRLLICTSRELAAGELTLRAMSLVYTTLLSLVPLLALAFSILKGLGIHNRIEPMLSAVLEPLGPSAQQITETVIGFVDNVKIGVLGSIGVALLFYTVLNMVQKVEASFNFIWKIPRHRTLGQRVSQYLVVLLLGPLAITLVLGTTASLSSNRVVASLLDSQVIGHAVVVLGSLLPFLLIMAVFSFLFAFIPNTRVRLSAAITGGVVSGLLWQSAAWGFARFVASSANYNAVYSSFAILILLLIWLYLAWIILLIGCQIAFFVQQPEYMSRHRRHLEASGTQRDLLILNLMGIVQQRFVHGRPGLAANQLTRLSGAPPDMVNPLINRLIETGLLAETSEGILLPQQDPSRLSLAELLEKANPSISTLEDLPAQAGSAQVRSLAMRLSGAREGVLGRMTLGELMESDAS